MDEIRGRRSHQNNIKRVVSNMEERNVGAIRGKASNKTTRAKDLTTMPLKQVYQINGHQLANKHLIIFPRIQLVSILNS